MAKTKKKRRVSKQSLSNFGRKAGLGNFNSVKGIVALVTSAIGTGLLGSFIAGKMNLNIDPRIVTGILGFFLAGPIGAVLAIFVPQLVGSFTSPASNQKSETKSGIQVWS